MMEDPADKTAAAVGVEAEVEAEAEAEAEPLSCAVGQRRLAPRSFDAMVHSEPCPFHQGRGRCHRAGKIEWRTVRWMV